MKFKLTVLLLMVISCAFAQEPSKNAEAAFKVGEQLNYRLKYGFFYRRRGAFKSRGIGREV